MKKFLVLLMVLALLVPAVHAEEQAYAGKTWKGAGFDSPEEAVQAYLEAMKSGSLKDMIATFAVETRAEHLDAAQYLAQYQVSSPQMYQSFPAASPYLKEILSEKIYNEIANTLYMQYLLYTAMDTEYFDSISAGAPISLTDEGAQAAFLDAMSSTRFADALASCEFVEWIEPGTLFEQYNSENAQQKIAVQATSNGADEICELAAHITLNGEDYLQLMSCVRYGDRWYNLSSAGFLANILGILNNYGGLVSMEELGIN